MSERNLWFYKGKVINDKEYKRVWAEHHEAWSKIYEKKVALEAKHRAEMDKLDAEFAKNFAKTPFTPWLGRASEGVIEDFLKQAKRDYKIKKEEHE